MKKKEKGEKMRNTIRKGIKGKKREGSEEREREETNRELRDIGMDVEVEE
jgi:hypothetical protein